jgi:hypothetical protein
MDPNSGKGPLMALKKGRASLATWKEYGVVYDITEGVLLLAHSLAVEAGGFIETPDEIERTAIPESLIEKITLFDPTRTEGVPPPEERSG